MPWQIALPIPHEDWLRLAVFRFGLTPRAFWALSLKEWLILTRPSGPSPLARTELEQLLQTYPDEINDIQ